MKASDSNNEKQFQNFWCFKKLMSMLLPYAFGNIEMSIELEARIQKVDLYVCVYTYTLFLLHFHVSKASEKLPTELRSLVWC